MRFRSRSERGDKEEAEKREGKEKSVAWEKNIGRRIFVILLHNKSRYSEIILFIYCILKLCYLLLYIISKMLFFSFIKKKKKGMHVCECPIIDFSSIRGNPYLASLALG